MDSVAVSLGGSFLVKETGVDVALTREIAAVLRRAAKTRHVLAVVGGGATARSYIQGARSLGASETALDDLGIAVTRINARVLLAALPEAYPAVPATFDEAIHASRHFPAVVMGGTHPGHTTDAVTVMLGDKARATRIVIATNVDGVYTADPKKDPSARHLARLTADELVRICSTGDGRAGGTGVVDALGAKMIARSGIETAVVLGTDLKALEAAIAGATDFHGTLVQGGRA
ncbi:MAG TPA: UMP kinase [Candidatus Thermoplasmatota archaeon]|nr:UMP kinase [Candidatus Thermoplasmatota archaeon]